MTLTDCRQTLSDRLAQGIACAAIVCTLGIQTWAQPSELRPSGSDRSLAIEDLVRQLGADSFQQREQAETQLRRLGVDALPLLSDAADDGDLEVRYRARRLATAIQRQQQRQLLGSFLTNYDPELSQQLAGWPRFSELVGDDLDARQLFVAMSEAEPELMSHIGRQSQTLPFVLEKRVIEMKPQAGQRPASLVVPAASTAVLLFASLDPASNPSATTRSVISRVVGESAFRRAASRSSDPPVRRLLAAWVREAGDIPAATRMSVGSKFQLREAVHPALELIRSPVHGSQLQYAVFTVARLGTGEHIPDLEKLLDNPAVLSERQRGEAETFTCQVRDVALVALIHLVGKHPREFGFDELRPNSNSLYALNTAGFDSDADRDAAFRQWKLWSALQRHEGRRVDENAVEGIGL